MKHGTYGGFTRGCRCDPCREAKRAYDRGYWRDGRHRPLPPLTDRFWAKVKVGAPDECWAWIGNRNGQGYGIFKSGSDKYRGRVRAHRFALALSGVEVPDGLIVCHRCDNPPCCNPAHLFLGTHADNMRDMAAKGRSQRTNAHKTHCKRGHEFDAANTYVNKRGFRTCRACQAMHARALYRALKGGYGT